MGKYETLAKDIVKNVGGKENVTGLVHCITRLRLKYRKRRCSEKDGRGCDCNEKRRSVSGCDRKSCAGSI